MKRLFGNAADCAIVILPLLCGCGGPDGPELAHVEGHVFLDGQPLPDASIIFTPENGSPSYGVTNGEGYYSLGYSASSEGAMVGKHSVRISTYRFPDEDEDGNPSPAAPERVPIEYNQQSTLTAEVKPGSNTIDFRDLRSSGEVMQPIEDDQ